MPDEVCFLSSSLSPTPLRATIYFCSTFGQGNAGKFEIVEDEKFMNVGFG